MLRKISICGLFRRAKNIITSKIAVSHHRRGAETSQLQIFYSAPIRIVWLYLVGISGVV